MKLDDLSEINSPSIKLLKEAYAEVEIDKEETEVIYNRLSERYNNITYYLNKQKGIEQTTKELLWQERKCLNQYLNVLRKRIELFG